MCLRPKFPLHHSCDLSSHMDWRGRRGLNWAWESPLGPDSFWKSMLTKIALTQMPVQKSVQLSSFKARTVNGRLLIVFALHSKSKKLMHLGWLGGNTFKTPTTTGRLKKSTIRPDANTAENWSLGFHLDPLRSRFRRPQPPVFLRCQLADAAVHTHPLLLNCSSKQTLVLTASLQTQVGRWEKVENFGRKPEDSETMNGEMLSMFWELAEKNESPAI